ncbi:MAG: hypothetical protein Fur0037_14800 [Planctomycetota bacterium]
MTADAAEKRRDSGFAYLMLAIVLAAIGVLLVVGVPRTKGLADSERRRDVRSELASIRSALEAYFYDHAAFPRSLTSHGFLSAYLLPRLGGTATVDAWSNDSYRYIVDDVAHTATVYSTDSDNLDQGASNESLLVVANGQLVGQRRTDQRLRIVETAVRKAIENGAELTGDWSKDRVALGMGAEYAYDGFGQPLHPSYDVGRSGDGEHGEDHGEDEKDGEKKDGKDEKKDEKKEEKGDEKQKHDDEKGDLLVLVAGATRISEESIA